MKKLLPFLFIPFLISCGGTSSEISVDEPENIDSSSIKYPEGEAVYLKTV